MANLSDLDLTFNGVGDISVLQGLTALDSLNLWGNNVVDISALSGLVELDYLNLMRNAVTDIAPLVANPGIDVNDDVLIQGNSLDCNDPVTQGHIAALEAREVALQQDCDD